MDDGPTGHAIIQVSDDGENSIIIDDGANRRLTVEQIRRTLAGFGPGDTLLLQNEVKLVGEAIRLASERGLRVRLTLAPLDDAAAGLPLDRVSVLLVNRGHGQALSGAHDPERAAVQLQHRTGGLVVMTPGEEGALACNGSATRRVPAVRVKPVDTTAAGDTFAGYFIAALDQSRPAADARVWATRAAALCVTRPGAMDSNPTRTEVSESSLGE